MSKNETHHETADAEMAYRPQHLYTMRRIPIEMILVLVLLGVAFGIAWSRWLAMETQLANHNARILALESDRAKLKRSQIKAWAGFVAGIAAKCLHKASFGLIRFQ
jgi:hypothetical protein